VRYLDIKINEEALIFIDFLEESLKFSIVDFGKTGSSGSRRLSTEIFNIGSFIFLHDDIESGLDETPSTHIEMFFLAPDEFSVGIESKKLSNSVISERSKLFESNDSNIIDLVVSSSIEQVVVNLTSAGNDLLDLSRFDEFFGELFEQDSSESVVELEFFQIGSSSLMSQ